MAGSRIQSYKPARTGTLKDAVKLLIAAVGGLERAATICRLNKSRLGICADPSTEGDHLPVDVVLSLERASGSLAVTEYLAASSNAVVIRLPVAERAGAWAADISCTAREASDVFAKAALALSDGVMTPGEAQSLKKEVGEALIAFGDLYQHLVEASDDD